MAPPGKFEAEALASLQRAVTRALERKRRLGHYAVFWEDGRVIFEGPDAPPAREEPAGRRRTGSDAGHPLDTDYPETGRKESRP